MWRDAHATPRDDDTLTRRRFAACAKFFHSARSKTRAQIASRSKASESVKSDSRRPRITARTLRSESEGGDIAQRDERRDARDHVGLGEQRRVSLVRHFEHVDVEPPSAYRIDRRGGKDVGIP